MCTCLPWNAVFFQQTNGTHLGKSCSYLWVRLKHAGACVNTAVHLKSSNITSANMTSSLPWHGFPFWTPNFNHHQAESGPQGSDGENRWVIQIQTVSSLEPEHAATPATAWRELLSYWAIVRFQDHSNIKLAHFSLCCVFQRHHSVPKVFLVAVKSFILNSISQKE